MEVINNADEQRGPMGREVGSSVDTDPRFSCAASASIEDGARLGDWSLVLFEDL